MYHYIDSVLYYVMCESTIFPQVCIYICIIISLSKSKGEKGIITYFSKFLGSLDSVSHVVNQAIIL